MTFNGAAYQEQRRDQARAKKLCGQCYQRPAVDSFRCDSCKADVNRKRKAARERVKLGLPSNPRVAWCDECLACGFHRVECSQRKQAA